MKFRLSMIERIRAAVELDNTVSAPADKLDEAAGFPEPYLLGLGLKKADLRRLEVWGLARRGYLRERSGWRKRWILVNPEQA